MRTNITILLVVLASLVANFANAQRAVYRDSRKITTTAARTFENNDGENRRYLKIDGNTSWYFKVLGGYDLSSKGALA